MLHLHSGNLFGGVETMLLLLARHRHLVPDMEPEFALSFGGTFRDELLKSGVPVHDLGEVRVRRPLSMMRARRRLREILRQSKPDVVLLHSFWAQAIFGSTLRPSLAMFAAWVHDLTDGRHWLERWAASTPPAIYLTSSEFIAEKVRARYPSVRVEAIHCPVETPLTPSRQRSGGDVVIAQVGRLERWKGHEVLLDALALLTDDSRWRCVIVGGAQRPAEREYLQSLHARASGSGLAGRVEFLGQRSDVADILSRADIYCQPNTRPEPFGIALVEAMLAGLPVVTSAMGGALEIVDSGSGVLVESANAQKLAAALRALIVSPEARRAAGARGRSRAGQLCDPARQMRRISAALHSAARR